VIAPHSRVLVLDASYTPLHIVPWEQAVVLLLDEKARMVTDYAGVVVRSANLTLPWPAVVALSRYVGRRRRVRFNRQNVLARDRYQCAYCGDRPMRGPRPDLAELTLDHVVPRAQAANHRVRLPWNGRTVPVTSWENVITCCVACNAYKADRTPEQAGLTMRWTPRAPTAVDALAMSLARVPIPDEWKDWVPREAAPWRDYWEIDLDEG
jgi:5-methylcytosine-specific restriction endonuclease McrA